MSPQKCSNTVIEQNSRLVSPTIRGGFEIWSPTRGIGALVMTLGQMLLQSNPSSSKTVATHRLILLKDKVLSDGRSGMQGAEQRGSGEPCQRVCSYRRGFLQHPDLITEQEFRSCEFRYERGESRQVGSQSAR